ncbi:WbuC family cupin fold metalloprotein [uncultured Draconibacterium sp.]|uniref:WbuC family cupin fold metalloprotein n=1 Tax=uncultured Draconibacterium sp. TaxID=1573823 RepID=UPI003217F683
MPEFITAKVLNALCNEAKESARLRKNHNYHNSFNDPINRMLNAIEPDSYVQPHKHENPDKREVFLLLKGKLAVVFFDNEGQITEHVVLDKEENFGVEIPPSVWHTIIALEPETVVYEIKDGPYSPADDKNFAAWAPKEGDKNCSDYLVSLIHELRLLPSS